MIKNKSPRSGFTLIELLTVIAIIGILAGILIPTVGAVKKKASMVTSSSNLKQIAIGYATYSNAGTRTRTIAQGAWSETSNKQAADMKDWAKLLAYHSELTDAGIWFISSDEKVSNYQGTIPRSIGIKNADGTFSEAADWTAIQEEVISYSAVVNMNANASGSTPLIWTKGLDTSGVWSITSPWQGEGGHIAFMDGHVEFFPNLSDEEYKLAPGSASGSNSSTSSIADAIKTTSTTDYLQKGD
jgi:prepilin-type N-terminal cleavage/methylation domain-containing protein/prepilin-type processing-associated H-X9-DG protein